MDRMWDIEELRNFIKNESSGGISKEEVEQLINNAISKIDTKETLIQLWINKNPENSFNKTNINLLYLENYTKLLIYYYDSSSNNSLYQQLIYIKPNNISSIDIELNKSTEQGKDIRELKIKTLLGRLIFDNCIEHDYINNTHEENNEKIIPYLILGIK